MCMVLYVAVDDPIPLVEWNAENPAFHVRRAPAGEDEIVRHHFTKPHIYEVGAHTGCACGFSYGQYEVRDAADRVEDASARESVHALRRYISALIEQGMEVEIFACWDGDQQHPAEQQLEVSPAFFDGDIFELPEKMALRVRRDPV